ncbi:NAD(P)H-dependent flavin oxidoreductase [Xanthovirga aplysinae]|uniref:NAD(P)H-dependent flavin oxidoreductase n=1 Tax=Xanthovirga aplysinae TaxID=2529853 RepID=UPI0012BB7CBC|nr:nitronate monooxygenase [Xanthovirga aplysinae]MTI31659.1 nitronate monooxygenase [Xanthovirga aplysinae]
MNWPNQLTETLGIKYPIIQAPMLGVTSPEMVGAASNFGVLGSLPVGGLSPDTCMELIRKTKSLTNKTFAVNVFANDFTTKNPQEITEMQNFLLSLCGKNNIPYIKKPIKDLSFFSYEEQIDILIQEKVPIVSFTFGILSDSVIEKLKSSGIVLIGSCTCTQEAIMLEEKDIDFICTQGIEAGAHRASFLKDEDLPQVGTFALVPQVFERIKKTCNCSWGNI